MDSNEQKTFRKTEWGYEYIGEMTAEQKVKARWPDAFAVREGGYYWIDDGVDGSINGTSSSEEAAWINAATHAAASRIESEAAGNPTGQAWAANGGPRHPKRENHAQAASADPAESKPQTERAQAHTGGCDCPTCWPESMPQRPQTESADAPGWKAEADRLAEALKEIADPENPDANFCNCTHDTEDCCVNIKGYWCPVCIAAVALASYAAKGGGR